MVADVASRLTEPPLTYVVVWRRALVDGALGTVARPTVARYAVAYRTSVGLLDAYGNPLGTGGLGRRGLRGGGGGTAGLSG